MNFSVKKIISVFFILFFLFVSSFNYSRALDLTVNGVKYTNVTTIAGEYSSVTYGTDPSGREVQISQSDMAGTTTIGDSKNNDSGECGISGFTNIWNCVEQLLYLILYVASLIVGLVGILFNYVFNTTVVTMSAKVAELGVVEAGWTTIRDLCNIAFIFILLYLAISTILQLDEHGVKHTLSRLIIMAILVNFSFFFFGTIIDASNILAIEIYGAIKSQGGSTSTTSSGIELGDAFFSVFNLQSVYSSSDSGVSSLTTSTSDSTATSNAEAFAKGNNTITVFVVGIIFMAVAGMVMLASLILFIKRFVILVFLLIFSPIAFAGMVLHKTEHEVQHRMWGTLLKESFYAPVYMFFIYLSLTTANTEAFKSAISTDGSSTAFGFLELGVIFNFAFIIVMLVFSIYAAEQVGVSGASGAINMFNYMKDKTAGAVWSTTGSYLAYNLIEKTKFGTETMKQMRQGVLPGRVGSMITKIPGMKAVTRGVGRATTAGLQKAGEARHHDIEDKKKEVKDTLHELRDDPKKQAEFIAQMMDGKSKLGGLVQPESQMLMKYVATEMKTDELANSVAYMRDAGKHEEADYMLSYAGRDVKTAVEDKIKNSSLNFHKDKMKELIGIQYDDHGGEVYSKTHNQGELAKFTSGLNAKQLASVLGNISQKQMEGLTNSNPNLRSGIQTILNSTTDANVFEQLQRDGNMAPEIRKMASNSIHATVGRKKMVDKMENVMNGDGKLTKEDVESVSNMFSGAIGTHEIALEQLKRLAKDNKLDGTEVQNTIAQIVNTYKNSDPEPKYSGVVEYGSGNGARWYEKNDDIKKWEKSIGDTIELKKKEAKKP